MRMKFPSILLIPLAILCSTLTFHSSFTQKIIQDEFAGSFSRKLLSHIRPCRSPSGSLLSIGRDLPPPPSPMCADRCCGHSQVCGHHGCDLKPRCGFDCCPPHVVQNEKLEARRLTLAAAGLVPEGPPAPRPLPPPPRPPPPDNTISDNNPSDIFTHTKFIHNNNNNNNNNKDLIPANNYINENSIKDGNFINNNNNNNNVENENSNANNFNHISGNYNANSNSISTNNGYQNGKFVSNNLSPAINFNNVNGNFNQNGNVNQNANMNSNNFNPNPNNFNPNLISNNFSPNPNSNQNSNNFNLNSNNFIPNTNYNNLNPNFNFNNFIPNPTKNNNHNLNSNNFNNHNNHNVIPDQQAVNWNNVNGGMRSYPNGGDNHQFLPQQPQQPSNPMNQQLQLQGWTQQGGPNGDHSPDRWRDPPPPMMPGPYFPPPPQPPSDYRQGQVGRTHPYPQSNGHLMPGPFYPPHPPPPPPSEYRQGHGGRMHPQSIGSMPGPFSPPPPPPPRHSDYRNGHGGGMHPPPLSNGPTMPGPFSSHPSPPPPSPSLPSDYRQGHGGRMNPQSKGPMMPGRPYSPPPSPPPHPPHSDHRHGQGGRMHPHPHANGPKGRAPSQGAFGPSTRGGFSAAVSERRMAAKKSGNGGMQIVPPGRMTYSSFENIRHPPPGREMGPKRPPAFSVGPPSIDSPVIRPAAFGAHARELEKMPSNERIKRCCDCCMPDCNQGCIRNGGCGSC